MNVFLYIIIFIMGTLFGSFYTLAVYRIPKGIDIVKTHSFCPNCGNKLGFLELIPVWSYLILGGKCKNCKQKIRIRYFILEILSGLIFVAIAYGLKIDAYNLDMHIITRFAFMALYFVAIFIIAAIDKEYREIERNVLYYALTISCAYIIYLCLFSQTNIYRYVMYLITLIILLIIECIKQRNLAEESYVIGILMLIIVMTINSNELITVLSVVVVLLSIAITKSYWYLKNALNKSKKEYKDMKEIYKFGYLLGIANTILLISSLFY